MPALEARLPRLIGAHTLPVGISVDSAHSHAAWAEQLGGIHIPLLSDFHPKGAVARAYGTYLEQEGICDRATVIVDAAGVVRYAEAVGPGGERDIDALVRRCEALDAAFGEPLPDLPGAPGLPEGSTLYVRDGCMFSRWALYARKNLHLEDALPVRNVSRDAAAERDLQELGGRTQAPCLVVDGRPMYESDDIVRYLVQRTSGLM